MVRCRRMHDGVVYVYVFMVNEHWTKEQIVYNFNRHASSLWGHKNPGHMRYLKYCLWNELPMHLMHDRRQVQTKYTNKFTEKFISCYLNVAQFVFAFFYCSHCAKPIHNGTQPFRYDGLWVAITISSNYRFKCNAIGFHFIIYCHCKWASVN